MQPSAVSGQPEAEEVEGPGPGGSRGEDGQGIPAAVRRRSGAGEKQPHTNDMTADLGRDDRMGWAGERARQRGRGKAVSGLQSNIRRS